MSRVTTIILLSLANIFFAQNVILNKVLQTHQNTDKIFYKLNNKNENSIYLGELEVQGFTDNDAELFSKIYKKAKEIGANTFSYEPFQTLDGQSKFDPWNYMLNLYYTPKEFIPTEMNRVYIFSMERIPYTIKLNKNKITFSPRSFTTFQLQPAQIYTLSTRNLLGASIKLSAKENQEPQYYQITSYNIKSSTNNQGGIIFKTGDIINIERSFADFLSIIYKEF